MLLSLIKFIDRIRIGEFNSLSEPSIRHKIVQQKQLPVGDDIFETHNILN